MPDAFAPVTAAGIALLTRQPPGAEALMDDSVLAAEVRLEEAIGSTNYASLIARTLTEQQEKACVYAATRFGAQAYYRDRMPPPGSKGILYSEQVGESTTNYASAEQIADMARSYGNQAIRMLDRVGLYQRPALVSGTVIAVADET